MWWLAVGLLVALLVLVAGVKKKVPLPVLVALWLVVLLIAAATATSADVAS